MGASAVDRGEHKVREEDAPTDCMESVVHEIARSQGVLILPVSPTCVYTISPLVEHTKDVIEHFCGH